MNQKNYAPVLLTATTVAAAAAATAIFAVAVQSGPAPARADVPSTGLAAASNVVGVLAHEQRSVDELPAVVAENNALEDIALNSTRMLGSDHRGDYFTSVNADGDLCLFIVTPDEWSAHTCAPVERVDIEGLWVQMGDERAPEAGTRAYLLSDETVVTAKSSGLVQLGPNLLVGPAHLEDSIQVSDADGVERHIASANPMTFED